MFVQNVLLCMHLLLHAWMYVCIYACMFVCICDVYMKACVYVNMYTFVCIYICVCVSVCVYMYNVYICMLDDIFLIHPNYFRIYFRLIFDLSI